MIQFRTIDRDIDSVDLIQKVEIKNSVFQNIYYEIGSIIRLPERKTPDGEDGLPWDLKITNTHFKSMSFCGSIISNDFPIFEGADGSHVQDFNNGMKNLIQMHYGKSAT